jgi:hypothetical protein
VKADGYKAILREFERRRGDYNDTKIDKLKESLASADAGAPAVPERLSRKIENLKPHH